MKPLVGELNSVPLDEALGNRGGHPLGREPLDGAAESLGRAPAPHRTSLTESVRAALRDADDEYERAAGRVGHDEALEHRDHILRKWLHNLLRST